MEEENTNNLYLNFKNHKVSVKYDKKVNDKVEKFLKLVKTKPITVTLKDVDDFFESLEPDTYELIVSKKKKDEKKEEKAHNVAISSKSKILKKKGHRMQG